MPDPAIRMVDEDVELLSSDPIQGHWTASPEADPLNVSRLSFLLPKLSRRVLTVGLALPPGGSRPDAT
jgi:hypothetical protein